MRAAGSIAIDSGIVLLRAEAHSDPHELTLSIEVISGRPARFLISHHVALNGDDGSAAGAAHWRRDGEAIVSRCPAPGSELAQPLPEGSVSSSADAAGTSYCSRLAGMSCCFSTGARASSPFAVCHRGPRRESWPAHPRTADRARPPPGRCGSRAASA